MLAGCSKKVGGGFREATLTVGKRSWEVSRALMRPPGGRGVWGECWPDSSKTGAADYRFSVFFGLLRPSFRVEGGVWERLGAKMGQDGA